MSQLLRVVVLLFQLLPPLLCVNLLCFYRPIMEKEKTVKLILTECPPDEVCYTADGRYGNYSALSTRGCVVAKDCSQVKSTSFKGTVYAMRYACCDWPYCNGSPGLSAAFLPNTVTLVIAALVAAVL